MAKFYAVARGRHVGIVNTWEGAGGAKEAVDGYEGAIFKSFPTVDQARTWLNAGAPIERGVARVREPKPAEWIEIDLEKKEEEGK